MFRRRVLGNLTSVLLCSAPLMRAVPASSASRCWVVSRSALGKLKVYWPRTTADTEDVRYTIHGFGVLIKNDFEV